MVRLDHTVKAIEVLVKDNVGKSMEGEEISNGGALVATDLDQHKTTRRQVSFCLGGNDPIRRESVRSAIERQARIEVPDLGGKGLDHGAGYVGRVGGDEVEQSRCSSLPLAGRVGVGG